MSDHTFLLNLTHDDMYTGTLQQSDSRFHTGTQCIHKQISVTVICVSMNESVWLYFVQVSCAQPLLWQQPLQQSDSHFHTGIQCIHEWISVTVICVSVMCTALTLTAATAVVWFSLPYRYTVHSWTNQCDCNLWKCNVHSPYFDSSSLILTSIQVYNAFMNESVWL